VAALTLLSPDAADRLSPLRAVLPADGPVRAAASAWDGRLTARFLSADAFALRRAVARRFRIDPTTPAARVADLTKDRRPR
jgi:urease accessory protein